MYSGFGSNTVTAKKVEERWTSTTVHAVFALPPLAHKSNYRPISVDLPLLNFGWTFTLSLAPEKYAKKRKRHIPTSLPIEHRWNPVALVFHRRGRAIPWGNASMHVELSLAADTPTPSDSPPLAKDAPLCTGDNPPCNNSTLLVTMEKIALAHSHSVEIKLAPCTLSLLSPSKISLILTISECPSSTLGLFHLTSGGADEMEARKWLAKQSGDRLLSRSLTTGSVYDVRFLACSVRSTSGSNGESLPETYAWLSVLKAHVDPSLARLSEVWTSILSCHENPDAKPVVEIPCPDGYEYELDSDLDEDEAVEPVTSVSPGEHDSDTLQGEETEGLGNPSSFEWDGVGVDVNLLDSLPEEFTEIQEVPPHSSSKTIVNCERTVVIKFAAHRTWHAFLWYCYTGHIEFCELKSQVEHAIWRLRAIVGDGPPSCSPKSMYRLADLIGDKDLKTLALKAIKARMTKTNVLEETFSIFTSKYPDVREVQLDILMEHRASSEVKKAFLGKISKHGVMPHAEPALIAFYDRLAAMEPIPTATGFASGW